MIVFMYRTVFFSQIWKFLDVKKLVSFSGMDYLNKRSDDILGMISSEMTWDEILNSSTIFIFFEDERR